MSLFQFILSRSYTFFSSRAHTGIFIKATSHHPAINIISAPVVACALYVSCAETVCALLVHVPRLWCTKQAFSFPDLLIFSWLCVFWDEVCSPCCGHSPSLWWCDARLQAQAYVSSAQKH